MRLLALAGITPVVLGAAGCDDGGESDTPLDGAVGADGGAPDAVVDDGFPQYEYTGDPGPDTLFQHGVASGDPLDDAVIIWTRVSTEGPVEVWYEVALDDRFTQRVIVDTVSTDADRDYTVKVDAEGLEPAQTYYYRFFALGRGSTVGRTKTAGRGAVAAARFAVMSCSSLAHGYFHAYGSVAARDDLDAVLHLGDYIYEYGSGQYGAVRTYEPAHEIRTLADYRMRYAQYRRDEHLQACHQQHPFVCIWDDHETANNSYRDGANNHDPASEGPWADRRAAGIRAFHEWLPIRDADDQRIFRAIRYGDLIDLFMLDTRLWGRDAPPSGPTAQTARFEERSLLGDDQEAWLYEGLRSSAARWRVLGQQVMMGQLQSRGAPRAEMMSGVLNLDQWDGYVAARDRLYGVIQAEGVDNLVVLTGDIHTSWAIELTGDPNNPEVYDSDTGAGSLGVEFVTPGITSPGLAAISPALINLLFAENPHIKYAEVAHRGHMVLDVTPEAVRSTWYLLDSVTEPEGAVESVDRVFAVYDGTNHLIDETPSS